MALESPTYISDLVPANPLGGDPRAQGDDHIRNIKSVLQNTFPNASRAFRLPTAEVMTSATINVATSDEQKTIIANATSSAIAVNLPTAYVPDGMVIFIVKGDESANAVTIDAATIRVNGGNVVLRKEGEGAICVYDATADAWYATLCLTVLQPPHATDSSLTIDNRHFFKVVNVDATGGNRTITCPNTVPAGTWVEVRKSDSTANTVTISCGGNVNGAASIVLAGQYEMAKVIFDGTTWYLALPPAASETVAGVIEKATVAETQAMAAGKAFTTDLLKTAVVPETLSYNASMALDWTTFIRYDLTMTGDGALGNPSNEEPNTARQIYVVGNNSTPRTLTFGNEFGGSVPTLADITSTKGYLLNIICIAASHFIVTAIDASPP